MPFTPLGVRTLEGFRKQYGPDGEAKFRQAMEKGLIDRGKMERPHKTVAPPKSAAKAPMTIEATNNEPTSGPGSRSAPKPQATVPAPANSQARAAPGSFQSRGTT